MTLNRREFIQYASSLGISVAVAEAFFDQSAAKAQSAGGVPTNTGLKAKVVVVGGGMAGATVSKYLRLRGGSGLEVTLVERDDHYTSHTMSNLVLNGQKTIPNLQYPYTALETKYGVKRVKGEVVGVDASGKKAVLADGSNLAYDRLILAPGLEFDPIPGLEGAALAQFPHAWKAGEQTNLLHKQIMEMRPGGTFIVTVPPAPYRCPPGPYERACVVADWLKTNKPGSKVIILDANPNFVVEAETFKKAIGETHAGVITYVPNAPITSFDPATKTIKTAAGEFKGDVINMIPAQRAGKIAQTAGLVNVAGRWAGVNVLTYESTAVPNIHVLGDSTQLPKSGTLANTEAKVCVDAITRILRGQQPDPNPVVTTACYTPITGSTASWLTMVFQYDPESKSMKVKSIGEAPAVSNRNYRQMEDWFNALMRDSFA